MHAAAEGERFFVTVMALARWSMKTVGHAICCMLLLCRSLKSRRFFHDSIRMMLKSSANLPPVFEPATSRRLDISASAFSARHLSVMVSHPVNFQTPSDMIDMVSVPRSETGCDYGRLDKAIILNYSLAGS
jgi:hypothetical protein